MLTLNKGVLNRILQIRQNMISFSTQKILYESRGSLNNIIVCKLNKPSALNALDEEMMIDLQQNVSKWENQKVAAVILSGEGGKAFCAGGDVKSLYYAKTNPTAECPSSMLQTFFWNEYKTDYQLATMNPTLVVLMDGFVMGGGVGLSVYAPVRIASEACVFAMPETKLGLFTDVGGGYFLSRLKSNLGMFLGLTGHRLKGADIYHAGLSDYFVPRDQISRLVEEITQKIKSQGQLEQIKQIVSNYHSKDVPAFSLKSEELKAIDETFTDECFEKLIINLQNHSNQNFTQKVLEIFKQCNPMSLRVTHEQIKRGKHLNLKDNLRMDYRLVQRFMEGQDFFEGVNSVLIDRQHKPQWQYKEAISIPQIEVEKYFQPLQKELDI